MREGPGAGACAGGWPPPTLLASPRLSREGAARGVHQQLVTLKATGTELVNAEVRDVNLGSPDEIPRGQGHVLALLLNVCTRSPASTIPRPLWGPLW